MQLSVKTTQKITVTHLKAECGVRYWEDGEVNGVQDEEGVLIPLRQGDVWRIFVNLDTGVIDDWPEGVTAKVHYKVCDAGVYSLIDADGKERAKREWYVPPMLSPGGAGYGDYVIMKIDGTGKIDNWSADLSYFEDDDE